MVNIYGIVLTTLPQFHIIPISYVSQANRKKNIPIQSPIQFTSGDGEKFDSYQPSYKPYTHDSLIPMIINI